MNKTMTRENIVNKAWAEWKPVCGTAHNVMCATRWTPEQTPKNNHEKFDLTPEEHSYKTSVMWFRVFYLTTPTIRYCLTCISQWKLNFFFTFGGFLCVLHMTRLQTFHWSVTAHFCSFCLILDTNCGITKGRLDRSQSWNSALSSHKIEWSWHAVLTGKRKCFIYTVTDHDKPPAMEPYTWISRS